MALPTSLRDELAARLAGRCSWADVDLAAVAGDASSLPSVRPELVVWATSTDDVVTVVQAAASAGVAVTARGAGSSLEGNPIPVAGGIVLDCSRMDRVSAVRPGDLQADVEPGVVYARLNRLLRSDGLFFPPSPGGSADVATIGGMLANNASGIYSLKYGATGDHVRAATVVTGTGEVLRLGSRARKTSSGYNLLGLLVGSEGTLGIVTGITLALAGLPVARRQGGFTFADAPAAARATADLVRSGLDVAAIEFLDAATMGAIGQLIGVQLPLRPCLLVEVHGSAAGAEEAWAATAEVLAGDGGTPLALPDGYDAWGLRGHATRAIEALRPDAITVRADLAVPIGALPTLVEACQAASSRHGLGIHLFGHAGIGILHTLMRAGEGNRPAAAAVRDALIRTAIAAGGACSGEHGMGLGNRAYATLEHGPAVALMQGVKGVFDPRGILNPGKIW